MLVGIVAGARRHELDLYPTLFASAKPKGPVAAEAFEKLTTELIQRIRSAPRLDGVILDMIRAPSNPAWLCSPAGAPRQTASTS